MKATQIEELLGFQSQPHKFVPPGVKRGQAEMKYHAALMDAYTEHLSVLEMTSIAAAEQKRSTEKQQA